MYPKHPTRSEQFLVYKILDAVTSTFFPVLTRIDDDIDEIEQDVIEEPTEAILQRIFSLKRDLVAMRRVISPERDVFARDGERIAELARPSRPTTASTSAICTTASSESPSWSTPTATC